MDRETDGTPDFSFGCRRRPTRMRRICSGSCRLCFADYPGCFVDPHDDLPDLRAPGTAFAGNGGAFWVLDDERGRVCACVAVDFPRAGHGRTASALCAARSAPARARREARGACGGVSRAAQGARHLFFWSDTRFDAAHRLYERLGYAQSPARATARRHFRLHGISFREGSLTPPWVYSIGSKNGSISGRHPMLSQSLEYR